MNENRVAMVSSARWTTLGNVVEVMVPENGDEEGKLALHLVGDRVL
jgi:hypothetical protein